MKRPRIATTESEPEVENDIVVINENVYFHCEVSNKTVLKLIQSLSEASENAIKKCEKLKEAYVYLYINSGGGDAFAGLSAMDHIRCNKVPIITIADGFVASAATLLLLGGYERKSLWNAKILIHQISTEFWGKHADLLDEVENSKELMNSLNEIYTYYTTMKSAKVQELIKKEIHMNSSKALSCGIVDDVW
mgnify:CR=1 FL=1|tara:strand:+ start:533 stop:1108 length:576 start_codon:yes stop_codon:yes gene_type:complete